MLITSSRAKAELSKAFNVRLFSEQGETCTPVLGDGEYYAPTPSELESYLERSKVDVLEYTSSTEDDKAPFVCNNFSWALVVDLMKMVYQDNNKWANLAAGVVYGRLPSPHAMVWVILNIDGELAVRLVEPQTDTRRKLNDNDGFCWAIFA